MMNTAPAANTQPIVQLPSGLAIRFVGEIDGVATFKMTIPMRALDDLQWDVMDNIRPMIKSLQPKPDGDARRMIETQLRVLPPPVQPLLITWRCPKCSRILARIHLIPGSIVEIKCGGCNTFSVKEAA